MSDGEATPTRLAGDGDLATALQVHARRSAGRRIPEVIADEPARIDALSVAAGPLRATFARQRYDRAAFDALLAIAGEADLPSAMRALLGGDQVNATERRAALHTALRGLPVDTPVARQAHAEATAARTRMRALVDALSATGVTDVVSIGIGGSDLGPRLVVDALARPGARFRLHFLSNVDGAAAQRVLSGLDPARTAAILVSKTFGTQETLLNGAIVRDWLGDHAARDGGRVFAVSANASTTSRGPRSEPPMPMLTTSVTPVADSASTSARMRVRAAVASACACLATGVSTGRPRNAVCSAARRSVALTCSPPSSARIAPARSASPAIASKASNAARS